MSNTKHLPNKQETNIIQTGYKLMMTLALAIGGLIIIGLFRYTSYSDTKQKSLNLQIISQTISLDQGQQAIPWLGLYVTDVTIEVAIKAGLDKVQGVVVQSVIFGSPACKVGL